MSTHPSRHQPKTTESTTNTKGTLPPEFDSDQSKRFITGRNQSKISTTKQIRRQRSKLRFRENTIRVHLHQPRKFLRSEPTIKINDRSDANQLNGRAFLQAVRRLIRIESHKIYKHTHSDGITSAIKSTPFCLDHRPTNTNRSELGSCLIFAHS